MSLDAASAGSEKLAIATASPPTEPAPVASRLPSLRLRALQGSAWTMLDYAGGKALSLVSNLILTRLLVPHEKGLMDLCSVVIMGLQMFSDIGIGPNIIFSKRGDKPEFLNTAWTIQVFRGAALFLAASGMAWPAAWFFDEPRLIHLLPVCGGISLIAGFTSTSLIMLNRQMRLGMITILDFFAQMISIGVMVTWAWYSPTVWALVAGSYFSAIFRVVYSFVLVREHKTRFDWNAEDARSMFRVGRWIFLSTVFTFLAMNLGSILFAKMLSVASFAIYGNAMQFAILPQQLVKKLGAQVSFPVLAEVARERPEELPRQFRRVRTPLVMLSLAIVVPLMFIAQPMINFLYEDEWIKAGPMLQILAIGAMGAILNITYGSVLLAMAKTLQLMWLLVSSIVILVTATMLGYHWRGESGFIWGVALTEWLNYPLYVLVMHRQGLWHARLDFAVIATTAAATALVFWLLQECHPLREAWQRH